MSGQNEDAGADDSADAECDQVDRSQCLFQVVVDRRIGIFRNSGHADCPLRNGQAPDTARGMDSLRSLLHGGNAPANCPAQELRADVICPSTPRFRCRSGRGNEIFVRR